MQCIVVRVSIHILHTSIGTVIHIVSTQSAHWTSHADDSHTQHYIHYQYSH